LRGVPAAALGVTLAFAGCSDGTAPKVSVPSSIIPAAKSVTLTALGETTLLPMTVLDQRGLPLEGPSLQWTSSNADVASVSSDGVVTAVGPGTATITARSGEVRGSTEVVVAQVAALLEPEVDGVELWALGDTLRLGATVRDPGGAPIAAASVVWLSADTSVATVSADGLLTAVANGSTEVLGLSGAAVGIVGVAVVQRAVAIEPSAGTLVLVSIGETATVSVTATDAGGAELENVSPTWVSSDPAVATVEGGVVTAVANGVALVVASVDLGADTVEVTVQQEPASAVLTPDSVVLDGPGQSVQLAVTVLDALGTPITAAVISWMSSDESVASVDAAGLVAAEGPGAATISVGVAGVAAEAHARVLPELTLLPAGPSNLAGQVATSLSLAVRAEDLLGGSFEGAEVTWTADPGSGSITSQATAVTDATGHAGAVWLLGTSAGAQRATATLTSYGNTVEVAFSATASPGPAASATIFADSILLSGKGETAFLSPTYVDAFGNSTTGVGTTWLSRDEIVATVSPDGLVTGLSEGSTYVVGSLGAPIDSLLVTVLLRGAITITFDDGFREAYDNAWPVFQQFALVGNIAVNPAQVSYDPGDFPAYMTKGHLDEVHAGGFSIVSHTMSHDSLTKLSLGDLDYELRASQEWIEAQGYNGGNVFIAPYHVWADRERNAVAGYYEAARGTSANIVSPDSLVAWRPSNPYDLTGIEADDLPYTTAQGRDLLRALLERTADEGAFLDVFFHHLPPANVADFEATLAVLNDFRERVLPYHLLYPRFARGVF